MEIENANSHPFKVVKVQDEGIYANSHPYKVVVVGGGGSEARVVEELPEQGEPGYIYLILKETTKEGDIYDEWLWALQPDETYGWEHIGTTNEVSIKLYEEEGFNTDGAMTQKAASQLIYNSDNRGLKYEQLNVGTGYQNSQQQNGSAEIGWRARTNNFGQVAFPYTDITGAGAGVFGIGVFNSSFGYNNSNYRLIKGVYSPQEAHDAANKEYVDTAIAGAGANTISSQDWSALWQ